MALKIAFYHLFGLRHCSQEKKKTKYKEWRHKKNPRDALWHVLWQKQWIWANLDLCFSFQGGREAIFCNCLQSLAPWFPGLLFFSKPWIFYWKYAYIFPYTTIQNSTITFVNNTMDAKPHITHFPPAAQDIRDATVSPSPVLPTHHHYHLWEK